MSHENDPKVGDRVIVNGGLVATIEHWDRENNRARWVARQGGATNTFEDHIGGNTFRVLDDEPVVATSLVGPEVHPTRDPLVNESDVDAQIELPLGDVAPYVGPEGEPK